MKILNSSANYARMPRMISFKTKYAATKKRISAKYFSSLKKIHGDGQSRSESALVEQLKPPEPTKEFKLVWTVLLNLLSSFKLTDEFLFTNWCGLTPWAIYYMIYKIVIIV